MILSADDKKPESKHDVGFEPDRYYSIRPGPEYVEIIDPTATSVSSMYCGISKTSVLNGVGYNDKVYFKYSDMIMIWEKSSHMHWYIKIENIIAYRPLKPIID